MDVVDYQISDCNKEEYNYIWNKLVEYNLSKVPASQEPAYEYWNKKIADEDGNVIAGCTAKRYCWNVVFVDMLWVDERYRKCGLGSKLLCAVEQEAKEKGCYLIHLDTFDFQAKDFYLRHGYEIFGKLEGCPKGHCRYYLQKSIL